MSKLTIKQKKFADEYIISGNATEAYLKSYAKQSRASAEANARKLLGNYSVKSYIDDRLAELEDKAIAKQDEVLKYLTSVMRGEQTEQVVMSVGDFKQEIKDIDVSAKDRIKAAELLGKRYGTWTDKLNLEGDISVTFVEDVPLDDG